MDEYESLSRPCFHVARMTRLDQFRSIFLGRLQDPKLNSVVNRIRAKLLHEERDALRFTLLLKALGPRHVEGTCPLAGLAAGNQPVGVREIQAIQRFQQGFRRNESDSRTRLPQD